jgi:G3E family GTPase
MEQIVTITKTGKFDYILIEASGICEPVPIAQTICALDGSAKDEGLPAIVRLDNIVAVVDALRLVSEFGGGDKLLDDNKGEEDIANLLVQQIEFCNTILINKTDLVSPDELKKVKAVIKTLQPYAKIIETTKSQVELSEVLDTKLFDFEKVYGTARWVTELESSENEHDDSEEHHHHEHEHNEHHHHDHHHDHDEDDDHSHCDHEHGKCCCGHHHDENHQHGDEYGISTFVYYRRRPFNRMKLELFAENWPESVIRAKGMMWFSDEDDAAYLFEQAGKQISASYAGMWLATADEEQIAQAKADDERIANIWDDKVGDREIKLVFIGQHMDKEKICKDLDACLD